MSTSHRSANSSLPWKDTSDNDGDGNPLKLSDVPRFKRNGSSCGSGSSDTTGKRSVEGSAAGKVGLSEPVRSSTPDCEEDSSVVDESDPMEEEVSEVRESGRGRGRRSDRSRHVREEAPIPIITPPSRKMKRGTSISAFKVGTTLSLRTSPRKRLCAEQHSLRAPVKVSTDHVRLKLYTHLCV